MFKSTITEHWVHKAESYQYKRIGRLARWWRKGDYDYSANSIEYGQNANEYVKDWIPENAKDTLICPECKVMQWSSKCMEYETF
jgi:hypothetical protein